jgi:UDP-N-acetylenolpyruvoylglucosamine reductase
VEVRRLNNSPASEAVTPSDIAGQLAFRLSRETLIRAHEPLARRTTLRVGGPADLYVEPASEPDLRKVLLWCAEQGWGFFVLGRGSNLVVRDGGFRGVVISLAQPWFSRIEITSPQVRCGAGARLKELAQAAKRQALAGFEFLEGIPGSVGGALRMNAGAMGGAIFDLVRVVRLMDPQGEIQELPPAELGVAYRVCEGLRTRVVLGAVLEGSPGQRAVIEQRLSEFSRKRWSSQPAAPSAGCMFKNPASVPAGRLIDELGLKGLRVGGAMVSLEHGNFLVNDGTATAQQVLTLIELVRDRVQAERGIHLETEVEIVGEP